MRVLVVDTAIPNFTSSTDTTSPDWDDLTSIQLLKEEEFDEAMEYLKRSIEFCTFPALVEAFFVKILQFPTVVIEAFMSWKAKSQRKQ